VFVIVAVVPLQWQMVGFYCSNSFRRGISANDSGTNVNKPQELVITNESGLSLLKGHVHDKFPQVETLSAQNQNVAHVPLLAVAMEGCSASTPTLMMAKQLLRAHDMELMENTGLELFKPDKNKYYVSSRQQLQSNGDVRMRNLSTSEENLILLRAMKQYASEAMAEQQRLLFKINPDIMSPTVIQTLKHMGTVFAFAYRANHLDLVVCYVRDCFETWMDEGHRSGFPVFAGNGARASLCFDRRTFPGKTMAYLIPNNLVSRIHKLEEKLRDHVLGWGHLFAPSRPVSTESLFAFEYSPNEETFLESLESWIEFLSFSNIRMDRDTVAMQLRPLQNSRHLDLHSEVIWNIAEVKEALTKANLSHYLRL